MWHFSNFVLKFKYNLFKQHIYWLLNGGLARKIRGSLYGN